MKFSHASMAIAGLAGLALLGACNKAAAPAASDSTGEVAATPPEEAAAPVEALLANGLTAEATVELRQTHLKAVGKAFKTIYEQSNAGSPDMAAIQAA
ncbi:MAG: hypothetical protein KDA53_18005, partial [Hyphomonas sp.]|nr:hypothetical protein [Hyphomonas sp.]